MDQPQYSRMPVWTPEFLEAWAKERAEGVQYYTGGKPVFCPPRNWEETK